MGHKSLCKARKLALGSMFPLCPIPPQHSAPCCTHSTALTDTGMSFLQDTAVSCFKNCSSQHLLCYCDPLMSTSRWEIYQNDALKLLNSVHSDLAPKARMSQSARLELSHLFLGAVGMKHSCRHTHTGCWYNGPMTTCRDFGTPHWDACKRLAQPLFSVGAGVSLKSCAKNSSLWCRTSTRGGVQVSPVDKS